MPTWLPDGLQPLNVMRPVGSGTSSQSITLYADPSRRDPLSGPVLAAIVWPGSDAEVLPGQDLPERTVWVSGHEATFGHVGADTWISWYRWTGNGEEAGRYGVVARRLTDDEVITAARHLVGTTKAPKSARITRAGLPGTLRPVAAGNAAFPDFYFGVPLAGQDIMTWVDGNGKLLWLGLAHGDSAAALLARFAASGRVGVSPGQPTNPAGQVARVWADGDLIVSLYGVGLTAHDLDMVAASLRPAHRPQMRLPDPSTPDVAPETLVDPGQVLLTSGGAPGLVWAAQAARASPGFRRSHDLTIEVVSASGSRDVIPVTVEFSPRFTPYQAVQLPGGTLLVGYLGTGGGDGVRLTLENGSQVAVPVGPEPPDLSGPWFSIYLPGKQATIVKVRATAVDYMGEPIAR